MYEALPHISTSPEHPYPSTYQHVPYQFLQEAIFAGGGFWTLEAAYGKLEGVVKTSTGYFGGSCRKPSYKELSAGGTGHTEAVKIFYDSRKITFSCMCDYFWDTHDPTDRAYLDFGLSTHHRSAIFYTTEEERKEAQKSKIRRQMKLNKRIVTKILAAGNHEFFLAENQHQKYFLQKYHRLCGSLELRSTLQFAESNHACKLNGILGMREGKIIDELVTFLHLHELPITTKTECEEIIEGLKSMKKEKD